MGLTYGVEYGIVCADGGSEAAGNSNLTQGDDDMIMRTNTFGFTVLTPETDLGGQFHLTRNGLFSRFEMMEDGVALAQAFDSMPPFEQVGWLADIRTAGVDCVVEIMRERLEGQQRALLIYAL